MTETDHQFKKGSLVVLTSQQMVTTVTAEACLKQDIKDYKLKIGSIGRTKTYIDGYAKVDFGRNRQLALPTESLAPLNLKTFFQFVIPGAVASLGLNRVRQK
ncbi:MAG: hypothetical protein Q7U68_03555 [Candidatus Roizmanbacteria bacterium]|nr:hypothetical protein [Candidatus Roizmanbacteria bacterium]